MSHSPRRSRVPVALMAVLALVASGLGMVVGSPAANAVVNPGILPLVRQAADESIVLLKNDNDVLPVSPDRTVSMFGRVQVDTFYGGYGSGALPNADHKTSILQGVSENTGITLNQDLASRYEAWSGLHPVSGSPFVYPEMPLSEEEADAAAADSDTAVVVIGRAAGEGTDTTAEAYGLQDAERT